MPGIARRFFLVTMKSASSVASDLPFPRAIGVLSTDQPHEACDKRHGKGRLVRVDSPADQHQTFRLLLISVLFLEARCLFFWDAHFGHTCAADAWLGAADSTQLMSLGPTLNTSSTAKSSTRIRVEHRFRRNAGGDEDSSLDPAANDRPSAAWTSLLRLRQGNGRIGRKPFRPITLFYLSSSADRALAPSGNCEPQRERRNKPSHPCTWRGPAANPADAALSIRPG